MLNRIVLLLLRWCLLASSAEQELLLREKKPRKLEAEGLSGRAESKWSHTPKRYSSKLNYMLKELHEDNSLSKPTSSVLLGALREDLTRVLGVVDNVVPLDLIAVQDNTIELISDLMELGFTLKATYGRVVSGSIHLSALKDLEDLKTLAFARPILATTSAGSVLSEAGAVMKVDDIECELDNNLDGKGVIVGVLSDSYDRTGNGGGAAADIEKGDLRPDNVILDDSSPFDIIDEGRAMMQLVLDVAPNAKQAFHTAATGEAAFAQGILDLADAGCHVIVDDIAYFAEPFFQDGIIAQAVDEVKERGIPYFSSAGNGARNSYESSFRSTQGPDGQIRHNFDPSGGMDTLQSITIPNGGVFFLSFQWDEPYASAGNGSPGSSNDLDICLYDEDENLLVCFEENEIGNDPTIVIRGDVSPGFTFQLEVLFSGGKEVPNFLKYIVFGASPEIEYATFSGTSFGHSIAAGGAGVGASFFYETPQFGVDPPLIEPFSSVGGLPILFRKDGSRLKKPIIRKQPRVTGPDGTSTTFFGAEFTVRGNTRPPRFFFFGTSAAAPNVAALASLMLQQDPHLTPDEVYYILQGTAIDMDDPFTPEFDAGFDFQTGYGFVDAVAAIGEVGTKSSKGSKGSKSSKGIKSSKGSSDSKHTTSKSGNVVKSKSGNKTTIARERYREQGAKRK